MAIQWSPRCNCRKEHDSTSGRCRNRGPDGRGVTDPTARENEPVYCEDCRTHCHPERKERES